MKCNRAKNLGEASAKWQAQLILIRITLTFATHLRQARMDEYGYETGRTYITDIRMREEEHWMDKFLKDINVPDKIDQVRWKI